ncbi:MAG: NeuD/PglB/VioB family sugar acetyltransferase [Muribaculaceae bacterium]
MKDIAIFGAGGFGREVACLIRIINESLDEPRWNFIGFFDDNESLKGTCNEYGSVIGGRKELNQWKTPLDIAIAIGSPKVLKLVAEDITNPLVDFPNVIAPSVTWLDKHNVRIGKGNIICSGCLISCNVTIGDFNVFNGFIPVGHDASIGNYNVIMPSCNISGGVIFGECNFMGVKSAVLQYLKIGNNTRIGAGSVVMRNTKDGYLYIGIPAQKLDV